MTAVALMAQFVAPITTDSPKLAKSPIWMRKCRQRCDGLKDVVCTAQVVFKGTGAIWLECHRSRQDQEGRTLPMLSLTVPGQPLEISLERLGQPVSLYVPLSKGTLEGMARKLIAADGDEAPAHVYLAIGHLLPPEFTDHLLDTWDRVVSEVRRDLGDDQAADY